LKEILNHHSSSVLNFNISHNVLVYNNLKH